MYARTARAGRSPCIHPSLDVFSHPIKVSPSTEGDQATDTNDDPPIRVGGIHSVVHDKAVQVHPIVLPDRITIQPAAEVGRVIAVAEVVQAGFADGPGLAFSRQFGVEPLGGPVPLGDGLSDVLLMDRTTDIKVWASGPLG